MLGTSFVVSGHLDWTLTFVSFPMAFITVSMLHSNNTRDIKRDGFANIKTFAMVIGVKASIIYYCTLTFLSYAGIITMVILKILPPTTLITLITIPIAVKNCRAMLQISKENMNPINDLDKSTAKLQLMFSLSLALALIVSIVI
jgi:1,4-dihydroxy-2-naphthoate octaprenyltransferase